MGDHYSDGPAWFDGQPFNFRFGNPPRPGLAYDTPPDPPPEGPEVWCRSCQWSHPTTSAHIYGRNQPRDDR